MSIEKCNKCDCQKSGHSPECPDHPLNTANGCSASTCSLPKQFDGKFYGYDMGKIFIKTKCGDTNVIDIRAWGYLIGDGGGLGMNEDDACEIQDQFERWVIKALNYYREND